MQPDHLSFKRAQGVCWLGFALQALLGLLVLVYAAVVRLDHAAMSAAWLILVGAVIWLVLAVVFDAHRRERLESMETEALRESGARDGSVFEGGDEELLVAARRQAWMHRFLVPVASLVLALVFVLLGLSRLKLWPFGPWGIQRIGELLDPEQLARVQPGWPIAIGIGIAVAGFIFARFVSGMAKQEIWSNLRGGAAQSAGMALAGAALAVCHFLAYAANMDTPLRWLQVLLPAAMVLLGIEIVLNFVLTVYRPRRRGEIPRPAFDSRVLAFVAAPDRIAESFGEALSYQFGIDVTSSWFYQLLSRTLTMLLLIGAVVVWLLSMFVVVRPNEQGLHLRNGRLLGEALQPGLHWKLPWPIDRIERVKTSGLHRLELASGRPTEGEAILWTAKHTENERLFIVRPSAQSSSVQESADGAVRDVALVSVEVPLYYTVTDLDAFERLAPPAMRDGILASIGRRELTQLLSTMSVDEVLGSARAGLSQTLRDRLSAAYDAMNGGAGAGIRVEFVGVSGVHPPVETAPDFEGVVQAEQQRKAKIEQAEEERIGSLTQAAGSRELAERIASAIDELNAARVAGADAEALNLQERVIVELFADAGGESASLLSEAQAERWARHMGARRRAAEYAGQTVAFESAPGVYVSDLYFRTLSDILSRTRVYLTVDGPEVWVDLKEVSTGANAFVEQEAREASGEEF